MTTRRYTRTRDRNVHRRRDPPTDENGRLFVVEMRGYSEDDKENLGRIRLLEDRDGDGRYDHASVYID